MKLKLDKNMQRVPTIQDDLNNPTDLANQPYYFDDLTLDKANDILKTIQKVLKQTLNSLKSLRYKAFFNH